MIIKQDSITATERHGAITKLLASGKHVQCRLMSFPKGVKAPRHHHPEEQIGFLLSGKMKLYQHDEEIGVMEPGDSFLAKPEEYHLVEALEDSELLTIHSPPLK